MTRQTTQEKSPPTWDDLLREADKIASMFKRSPGGERSAHINQPEARLVEVDPTPPRLRRIKLKG